MSTELEIVSERDELFAKYTEEINGIHQSFVKAAESVGNSLLAGANYRREMGEKLASLKEAKTSEGHDVVPHGQWQKLFLTAKGKSCSCATFGFDHSTATRYMEFARKHPEPITDLKQIARDGKDTLLEAGLIEAEEGNPGTTLPGAVKWISYIQRTRGEFEKMKKDGAFSKMNQTERDNMKQQLRPLVEVYETL